MKVAFIGQKGIPSKYGGVEKHVEELASRLIAEDVDVSVYVRNWYTDRNLVAFKGVRLIHLPSINTKHLDAITHSFFSTIHALFAGYDVIHYHGVGPSLLAWIPRAFSRAKVVSTFHCIDRFHKKWGVFSRLMLRFGEWASNKFAHETIAVSRSIAQYCALEYSNKVNYIPNGVSIFTDTNSEKILNVNFGLEKSSYFLMVSRLVSHKCVHHLIEAFKKLNTDKKLVIVGDSVFTDDYVTSLHQMAVGDKRIIFTGFQSGKNLSALFENAYMCVHPSESEGLPISVLEAQAYGTAILVSDIPENLEAVGSGGFSFFVGNIDDLHQKMQFALDNKEFVDKLANYGKNFVAVNFNWDEITLKTIFLYKKVRYRDVQANIANYLKL